MPNSCCMIFLRLKKKKKKKTDFIDTGILSSAGYNCEFVYNHEKYLLLHTLLVQHLTVSVLIWGKKKKASKCQMKIFLIEFVEVPLEFNIIF